METVKKAVRLIVEWTFGSLKGGHVKAMFTIIAIGVSKSFILTMVKEDEYQATLWKYIALLIGAIFVSAMLARAEEEYKEWKKKRRK